MQPLNSYARDMVFKEVRAMVMQELGVTEETDRRLILSCLMHAAATLTVLNRVCPAQRYLLQAGTAYWPRLAEEEDDGRPETQTHFGYEWSGRPLSDHQYQKLLDMHPETPGIDWEPMKEIHVWVGNPDTMEIIDMTTGLWPNSCKLLIDKNWTAPLPPKYLWTTGAKTRLPDGVVYIPQEDAIRYAVQKLLEYRRDSIRIVTRR